MVRGFTMCFLLLACLFFHLCFPRVIKGCCVNIKLVLWYTMCLNTCFLYVLVWRWFKVPKISLFVRKRKQGCYIASVPLKKLVKLSESRKKRWTFKDGWLILEAF